MEWSALVWAEMTFYSLLYKHRYIGILYSLYHRSCTPVRHTELYTSEREAWGQSTGSAMCRVKRPVLLRLLFRPWGLNWQPSEHGHRLLTCRVAQWPPHPTINIGGDQSALQAFDYHGPQSHPRLTETSEHLSIKKNLSEWCWIKSNIRTSFDLWHTFGSKNCFIDWGLWIAGRRLSPDCVLTLDNATPSPYTGAVNPSECPSDVVMAILEYGFHAVTMFLWSGIRERAEKESEKETHKVLQ